MKHHGRPAQLGFDPSEELDHLEWLGHVVVRAELEADDLVDHLAACSQHDDGRLDPPLAQLA